MGVNLKDLIITKKEISFEELRGKVIAIDAYNALYQFLATIRQPNGTPLMDSLGRVTSHLNGLLYRTINFLEFGIKPVYVFDGKPPEIKRIEIKSRLKRKKEASKKYVEAIKRGDIEEARVYAQQTSRLTKDMVEESKKLLDFLGIPWVQAPSEGEAQAAYLVKRGDAWASASQDYDSLLYGAPRLVRNLTVSGRRKLPRRNIYIEIRPELILLSELLKKLEISREQLIDIAIIIGTDYDPNGIKGIGIKRALKLIKKFKSLEKAKGTVDLSSLPVSLDEIRNTFLKPRVTDEYKIEWKELNDEGVVSFLCKEHDFSEERVRNALIRAKKAFKIIKTQTSLEFWFK